MKRLLVLVGLTFMLVQPGHALAAAEPAASDSTHFFGRVRVFGAEAPPHSHVRARVASVVCADATVSPKNIAGETKQSFDIELPAGACGKDGDQVQFEWYRDDPAIATTCTPPGSFKSGADVRIDIACGVSDEFSATWIVQNATDQVQRSLEIFPRVLVGEVGVQAPDGCGVAAVYAGSSFGPVLVRHAEIVFSEPCIPPGAEVRLGLSTDCPCHSELEIQRVVWLPRDPLFKANVDCDPDVDAADALRDLLIAAQLPITPISGCPAESENYHHPNALGGLWGDVNCDGAVTPLDAVIVLKVATQITAGLTADCWSQYYGT